MKKKFTAICLVLIMLLSILPTAMADESTADAAADVRVYVRSYDIKEESTGGMVANAEYTGAQFRAAFPGANVRVSTGAKTRDEVYAEMDSIFAGSTENTKNYVVLDGHGSENGYHFIFNKNQSVKLPTLIEKLNGYDGTFFLLISGCFTGQWIDPESHPEFIAELDGYGGKFNLLTDASDENLYRPFDTGAAASITGKWADGLTISIDAQGLAHIEADLNDDGILTTYELLCYGSSSPYSYDSLYYPESKNVVFMQLPFRATFYTGIGGDFADGSDKLTVLGDNSVVNAPADPVPLADDIVFDGWFTSSDGGTEVSFPLTLEHHRSIYAQWSRDGQKLSFSAASAGDTVRIVYKDGSFCDYYILDAQHTNDGNPGMFLVAKKTQGNTHFAYGLSSYTWAGSQAQQWCASYYDAKVGAALGQLIVPSYAGSSDSSEKLNGDKIFFLSRDEVEKYMTVEQNESLGRWWIRASNSKYNLYYYGAEFESYYNPLMSGSLGARPAFNLNIGTDGLLYNPVGDYYTLKALENVPAEPFTPIDLDYYVKLNGEIIYVATGDRDGACDEMNTMAETPWSLFEPTAYNVFGGGKTTLAAGNYKGIPYSQYTRDFSSVDNLTQEFAENGIRGLDCSSATCYAIRKATDSDVLRLNGADTVYRTRNFVGDALNTGDGYIEAVSHNGQVPYKDFVTIVGDYGSYAYGDEINTKLIIENIREFADYAEGNIYDHVYAKMKPGDILVRHYYKGEGTSNLSSHTQLVTGVELVYNEDGILDPDKSLVYFTDTSSPNRTTFRATGEKTAWANGNTVTKNYLTFTECTDSACLIPVTMNEWKDSADVIVSGANSVWMRNSDADLDFTVNVPSEDIRLVRIDGESVAYTVNGNSVIHIGRELLATLSNGEHNIAIVSEKGEAVAFFRVVPCNHSMATCLGSLPATCTEDGYSGDLYCPNCDKIVENGKVIPATGHTPEYIGAVPATHTSEGCTGTAYCKVCHILLAENQVIPMLPYGIDPEVPTWEKGSEASLMLTVNMPKSNISSFYIDKTSYGYTYSQSGGNTFIYLKAATLEKLSLGEHTVTVNTKDGFKVSCTIEITKPCEHVNTVLQNQRAATCTEDGYSGDICCLDCNTVITEGTPIACTGHSPASERVGARAATCTESGYTGDTICTACGQTLENGETTPAHGHDYKNGKCTYCGEKEPQSDNFFTRIINAISSFVKSLFSWLPF